MILFITKVLKSFIYAFNGIVSGFGERNMKVHGLAALLIIALSLFLNITLFEWLVVLLLIGLVIAAELVNTAVEELSNIVRDELKLGYVATKRARDVAAGAVLMIAIVAAIIGSVIFVPRLLPLLYYFS